MLPTKPALSLIEMIIALAIGSLIAIAMGQFITSSYRTIRFAEEQHEAIASARRGVETMIKEIRSAKSGADGSFAIQAAEDYSFTFFADIDNDNAIEKVRYYLDGTNLKKGIIEPTTPPTIYPPANETVKILSPYVRNHDLPIFKYFNGDYPGDVINNPLPTPTRLLDTKLMQVTLLINVDESRAPNSFILESQTQLRNLKTNL